mmetsp:Transcript_529/g.1022  ORF Transcript_529/g.1022 Transcript_529/m.1022 type:complete len:207 (+) Transcript_529:251-871(+)
MRCVKLAICTSLEPVSCSLRANAARSLASTRLFASARDAFVSLRYRFTRSGLMSLDASKRLNLSSSPPRAARDEDVVNDTYRRLIIPSIVIVPPRTPLVAATLGAPLLKCSPLPSAIALNLIIKPPPLVAVIVPRLIIFKVNSKNAKNYAWLEFGERFLPIPTTTLTKRRLYLMRWNARPLGCFFFSCLATLGVWPRTFPARAKEP